MEDERQNENFNFLDSSLDPPVTAVWRVDWRLSHCTFVLLYPLFITAAIAHVNKVKIRESPLKVGISYKPEKNF